MFSFEFCEISKNTFSTEYLHAAASENAKIFLISFQQTCFEVYWKSKFNVQSVWILVQGAKLVKEYKPVFWEN